MYSLIKSSLSCLPTLSNLCLDFTRSFAIGKNGFIIPSKLLNPPSSYNLLTVSFLYFGYNLYCSNGSTSGAKDFCSVVSCAFNTIFLARSLRFLPNVNFPLYFS